MKALIMVLIVMIITIQNTKACDDAFSDQKIKNIIAIANEIADEVNNGAIEKYKKGEIAQQKDTYLAIRPIDFSKEKNYNEVLRSFGLLQVEIDNEGKRKTVQGSSFKIGKSCVMTDAHVLFPYANLQDDAKKDPSTDVLKSPYKITFKRNHLTEEQASALGVRKEINGKVLFAMLEGHDSEKFQKIKKQLKDNVYNDHWDYEVNTNFVEWDTVEGNRVKRVTQTRKWQGESEPAIVKLEQGDEGSLNLEVFDTNTISEEKNPYGLEMECIGVQETKMERKFGSCTGNQLVWKTTAAFVLKNRKFESGTPTNAPFERGFSGGACFLKDKDGSVSEKVFALPVNGLLFKENGDYKYPNMKFEKGFYASQNSRYIGTFVRLDKRLKKLTKANGKKYSGLVDYVKENCN